MNRKIIEMLSNAVPGYHEAICPHPEGACTCSMKPQVELMAPVVERLLAQEREPMDCGHSRICWLSVCSAHPFYEQSCGNCQCGRCSACAERDKFVVIIRRLTTYVDAYGPRDHVNGAATKKLVKDARDLTAPSTEEEER